MSTPPAQPSVASPLNVKVGGGLTVPPLPEEMAYPLRREQFDLLCETESINEDKRWRDVALAFFAAAVAGFLGFLGSIDWNTCFASKNWFPLKCAFALGILTGVSFAIFLIQQIKVSKRPEVTGYSRVKATITNWYEQNKPAGSTAASKNP